MHRSIIGHWVFADDALFYLWSNLLLRANWKSGKFWPGGSAAPVTVGRGQLLTGRNALHAMLYPTRDREGRLIKRESPPPHPTTLWRWLEAMQKDGMVKLDVRKSFTIVTICNYNLYQNVKDDDAQPVRNPCASDAQDVRRARATGAQDVRTIEEETKKEKKEEEGKKEECATLPPSLQTEEFKAVWKSWEQHRKELRKPLKPTMAAAQLKHLEGMGQSRAIACIRHTITMGWQGLREAESDGRHTDQPIKRIRLSDDNG